MKPAGMLGANILLAISSCCCQPATTELASILLATVHSQQPPGIACFC